MSLFVDTSAFYAAMVRTEEGHEQVGRALRDSLQRGRRLFTTNYVVLETLALLQHRIGLAAVRDLEGAWLPLCETIWVDQATHRRAFERLLRADRRALSLVDCSSFVVMEAEGIREALTLDADFRREGFRVLPRH